MKHWKKKGEYGYRTARRKVQLGIVAIFAVIIIAMLLARVFFMEPDSGISTITIVFAVLLVLPMANTAAPMLAAWKIKETPERLHEICQPYEEQFPVLYDLIITSKDMILPMDVIVIHPTGVYCYCTGKKVRVKEAEKYLDEMLVHWKLDGNAKVLTEEKNFLRRLESLKPVTEEEDDGSAPHVAELLKNISM